MATRSIIGIRRENGTYDFIMCHFDGYLELNGEILHQYYQDKEKIESLIRLGNISVLGKNLEPEQDQNQRVEEPLKNVTIAYHRDRNEKYHVYHAENGADFQKFADCSWVEFIYLYDEKKSMWLVNDFMDFKLEHMISLEKAIEEEVKISENIAMKMN